MSTLQVPRPKPRPAAAPSAGSAPAAVAKADPAPAAKASGQAVPRGASTSRAPPAAPAGGLLDTLEGVGPHLAEALRRHFRTDAAFLAAVQRLDLGALMAVDGVSERKALDLVRQVLGHDRRGADLLATPAARKVHDELLERVVAHASTAHGRNRLRLLAPLATPKEATAAARRVLEHAAAAAAVDRDQVRRLLRRIHRPTPPPPRFQPGRLVLADDDNLPRLQALGVQRWASLGPLADLERAAGHDLVLVVAERETDLAAYENALDVPSDAGLDDLAPEATLAWFEAQRGALEAAAALSAATDRPGRATEILAVLGGPSAPQVDGRGFRAAVQALRGELEALLRERVAGLSLTGAEVLETLGKRLPAPVQKAMDDVLAEGRRLLRERTGIDARPYLPAFPLAIDDAEVDRIVAGIESKGRIEAFQQAVKAARRLAALRPVVEAELAAWLEFDADFALGCFALENGLHPATFGDGIAFRDSVHLDLAADPAAQRIAYRLGDDQPRVALLTGANSGGKTTLLEHLAQLVLMARMGLPVVGQEVTVPWVEELHYVTARRSLDAGAFESFLKAFLPVALGDRPRLVLADEVESVTELEAAGRILGFFLDRLAHSRQAHAVVVSHMAAAVLRHCTAPVRVDGIEATGLDADNRLVVDRSPVMGRFARSTPELILQRLAATAKGPPQALYRDLLGLFADGARPDADRIKP